MAVTKIRKLSKGILWTIVGISIIVFIMFFFGGVSNPGEEVKNYVNTGLFLNWTYIVFFLTIVCWIVLAGWQFIDILKTNPKATLKSTIVVILFALMLVITYSIGDGTPLTTLNADAQTYNTPSWLKVTDMWIQSSIVLFVLIVAAICWGTLKRALHK